MSLLAAATLASCGQGGCSVFRHPFAPDGGPCLFAPLRFDRYPMPGEEVELELGVDEKCNVDLQEGLFPISLSGTVQVFSPDGGAFPHDAGQAERRQLGSSHYENVIKVKFTADQPGTWTIAVQFGSRIGATRQHVEVPRWRSGTSERILDWPVPEACRVFDVTERGTVTCVKEQPNFQVVLETSTGQAIPGRAFFVVGNALWRLTADGGVERREDIGGTFQVTHSVAAKVAAHGLFASHGDAVWLIGREEPWRGPHSLVSLTPLPDGGIDLRAGGAPGLTATSFVVGPEGPLWFSESERKVRAVLADGGPVSFVCEGPAAGTEPGVLWMGPSDFIHLTTQGFDFSAVWLEAGELRWARLALPHTVYPETARWGPPLLPVTFGAAPTLVPVQDGVDVALEAFDAGSSFPNFVGASRHAVFARSPDGTRLKVISR